MIGVDHFKTSPLLPLNILTKKLDWSDDINKKKNNLF